MSISIKWKGLAQEADRYPFVSGNRNGITLAITPHELLYLRSRVKIKDEEWFEIEPPSPFGAMRADVTTIPWSVTILS